MMVLLMFCCQMRITAVPSAGTRRIDQAAADSERTDGRGQVAAVAAPVDESLVDRDLPEQVIDVVTRAGVLLARITVLLVLDVAPPMPSVCLP
jgi:hypothetical protein